MFNLLTAEKIKVFRSKKLWIVLSILLLLPIMQVVNSKIEVANGKELSQVIDTVINGATAILMMEKNGFTILLIMSAFICFYIGEEFQNGTIRNALSLGRSRTLYYLSKLMIAALVSLAGVFVMTVIGIVSFSIVFDFGEVAGISNYLWYAVKAFTTLYVLILGNVSIYVMISFLTKNSGISLIWSFLYTTATAFLPEIFLQTEHFKYVTYWFTETYLNYADFANPTDIAKFPEMIIVSLITIMISSVLGILLFKRTDIK